MGSKKKTTGENSGTVPYSVFEKANKAIASIGDEKELASAVLDIAREYFGGDHGVLLELEDTTGDLREIATYGSIEEMLNQDMRIFAQYATDHPNDPESVIIAPEAKEVKKLAARKSVRRDMTEEVLLFPLVSGNMAVGAIYLGSKQTGSIHFSGIDESHVMLTGSLLGEMIGIDRTIRRLHRQNSALQRQVQNVTTFDNLVGTSEGIKRIKNAIDLVLDTDIPVTLIGEKGTGKRLIASIIHNQSSRRERPFIVFEASEIPEQLLAGALFGQASGVRGAPSKGRFGALREAKGGTLFINDMEVLPLAVQSQLMTALERGEMIPIGDDREYLVDVRLVFATRKNIKTMYNEGEIKPDLYQRLCQFPILIPPLRDRIEDIPLLVPYFVEQAASTFGKKIAGISTEVYDYLGSYIWTGNIAELEREVRQAVLRTPDRTGVITASALSPHLVSRPQPVLEEPGEGTLKQRIARIEKKMIIDALEHHNHNQSMTADTLGLSRQALINKLQRYGIETGRKYKRKLREIQRQVEED